MSLPRFEYRAATTVREAMTLWAEQPGSRYIAGGTDLLPQMRAGRKVAPRVVDLKRIPELAHIRQEDDGAIAIGACVPMNEIAAHPAIVERYKLLVDCISEVGAWPLRNRATLAGNICNASPAADTAVALVALDAQVVVASPGKRNGARRIAATDFFAGPGRTVLADGELVTEVVLPAASAGFVGSYQRLSRRRGMDLATVGVLVGRSAGSSPAHRIALAAVAPTPLRVREAEELLDKEGLGAALKRAAEIAEASCSPITDTRGTSEYRRQMVGVLVGRGLAALQ
jgi:CO/xanthine dehydrogenase FAD-binding subunit